MNSAKVYLCVYSSYHPLQIQKYLSPFFYYQFMLSKLSFKLQCLALFCKYTHLAAFCFPLFIHSLSTCMSRTQKSITGAVSHFSAESEVLIVIVFLWLACLLQGICLLLQHRRSPRIPFKPLGSILISAAQRRKEKYRKDNSVPQKMFKKTDIDGGQGN